MTTSTKTSLQDIPASILRLYESDKSKIQDFEDLIEGCEKPFEAGQSVIEFILSFTKQNPTSFDISTMYELALIYGVADPQKAKDLIQQVARGESWIRHVPALCEKLLESVPTPEIIRLVVEGYVASVKDFPRKQSEESLIRTYACTTGDVTLLEYVEATLRNLDDVYGEIEAYDIPY